MRIRWGSLFAILLFAVPLWAALGEPEQSVEADRARMAGRVKRTVMASYTLHEISTPDGRTVREFVSPSGTVFAVAWQGPFMPDLAGLLGSYAAAFQQAAASPTRRRGPLVIQTGSLVVVSGGHARSFQGRAYVTDLIPANVSRDVIQ